jgi:ABC-type lipoprotein export system ATPase subunit
VTHEKEIAAHAERTVLLHDGAVVSDTPNARAMQ